MILTLNKDLKKQYEKNRENQNLHLRVNLIEYMQTFGNIIFILCFFDVSVALAAARK